MTNECPCGTGLKYQACCGKFIAGTEVPITAEQLMRSRYTAYTLSDYDYLKKTWYPVTCPPSLGEEEPPRWIGLTIHACDKGGQSDNEGSVEFTARYKVNGKAFRLHETSEFTRIGERWFYVGGVIDDG